jgi:transketolase
MRNKFAEIFYDMAKVDSKLVLIVADISPAGSIEMFRKNYPSRFINTGVSEQIMIGMSAGLAQRGWRPFVYTIATFALYRPFEFIRDDLCYQNLPVTIVGIGGGRSYTTLGATHHAQEDIGLATLIPNLKIIAPCDPLEVEEATKWCAHANENGPVYLRLGKSGEPELTNNALEAWRFGKIRKITSGKDMAVLTYGAIAKTSTEVVNNLKLYGIFSDLFFVSTLKPFDELRLIEIFKEHSQIVIIEEHIEFGGLATQVQILAQKYKWLGSLKIFNLPNDFSHSYSNPIEFYKELNLDTQSIVEKIIS